MLFFLCYGVAAPRTFFLGWDDRSHRISCGTRGRLRSDGHTGHQKSTQVSKQSPTGESPPKLQKYLCSFTSNWSLFLFCFSTPQSHPQTHHFILILLISLLSSHRLNFTYMNKKKKIHSSFLLIQPDFNTQFSLLLLTPLIFTFYYSKQKTKNEIQSCFICFFIFQFIYAYF